MGQGRIETMRITSFVQLKRMAGTSATGVGRHALSLLGGLTAKSDILLNLAATHDDIKTYGEQLPRSISNIPTISLPISRAPLEIVWKGLGVPNIDRWLQSPDWIYCPAEAFVPTKRSKLAVTIHDLHALEEDLPWSNSLAHLKFSLAWRIMLYRISRKADLLLTVSEFSRQRIIRTLGVDPQKVSIVGNGVDLTLFKPKIPTGLDRYIIVVGGLTERKGGHYILEAARILGDLAPQIHFKIVGRSEKKLELLSKNMTNIKHLGYVDDRQLADLYGGAQALYFPAIYEGFGIPVIESLSCGTPVVCSDHPALKEAGRGMQISIPLGNSTVAVEELLRIINDRDYSLELREKAISNRDRFSWTACIENLTQSLSRQ
jgi:glycosyltransferase involved in cell wall biosynthesis